MHSLQPHRNQGLNISFYTGNQRSLNPVDSVRHLPSALYFNANKVVLRHCEGLPYHEHFRMRSHLDAFRVVFVANSKLIA